MWPPNSPDLNPVDYAVWDGLQQMVYQRRHSRQLNQLKHSIVIEWGKLLQRFTDRAMLVIGGLGGTTGSASDSRSEGCGFDSH